MSVEGARQLYGQAGRALAGHGQRRDQDFAGKGIKLHHRACAPHSAVWRSGRNIFLLLHVPNVRRGGDPCDQADSVDAVHAVAVSLGTVRNYPPVVLCPKAPPPIAIVALVKLEVCGNFPHNAPRFKQVSLLEPNLHHRVSLHYDRHHRAKTRRRTRREGKAAVDLLETRQ